MPDKYTHKDDNKLHTRWSELISCTDEGLPSVLERRFGLKRKLELDAFEFGKERHKLLEEEGKVLNRVPDYFGIDIEISHSEKGFAIEVFPNVVIHFTPDLISEKQKIIGDYKMCKEPQKGWSSRPTALKLYSSSMQLDFYAWLLTYIKIPIKEKVYMVEYWNHNRDKILGHDCYRSPMGLKEKGNARAWAIDRIKKLMAGRNVYLEAGYREVV